MTHKPYRNVWVVIDEIDSEFPARFFTDKEQTEIALRMWHASKLGNRVFMTGNVSVPQKILEALVKYAPHIKNVEICQALSIGPADYVKPGLEEHIRVNTLLN